ncbi:Tat pathway signal protein [Acrocarpospora pleiomorpha]|uniref:Tat pathway signal protein n=1 Tax=Acrocarpospora pleiomorpha TaxID=90975 RepID=A0A5M3XB04_9ACTN|nr:Tat pathway signal protein [Acrocarpospora pleiomorpha]GES18334.1 Tat pathway signal protein [Acrocarpospora pleiomorpha]
MSSLPAGQHEWEATFGHDELGRPVPPRHHRLILADLIESPDEDAARLLESRLAVLEERHAYGPDGLLTTVGWGPAWWDEHTSHVGLITVPSKMSRWEDPVLETPHAIFHLASDHQDVLESAGDALFGSAGVGEHLKVREVRTGFVGAGLVSEALPHLNVPETAPLLLGFHSVLRGNQATEESITILSGPLAGGTTQHVSRIELDVERWHAKDRDEQAALLYAPTVTAAEADRFSDDAPSDYESYERTVREHGIVGHAQAAARARVDNVPVINRRDFATVDDGKPGTHFVSLQRELRDFNNTRAIMNAADGSGYHHSVGTRRRNGINAFFDVTHRATAGIPPRGSRAYPELRS